MAGGILAARRDGTMAGPGRRPPLRSSGRLRRGRPRPGGPLARPVATPPRRRRPRPSRRRSSTPVPPHSGPVWRGCHRGGAPASHAPHRPAGPDPVLTARVLGTVRHVVRTDSWHVPGEVWLLLLPTASSWLAPRWIGFYGTLGDEHDLAAVLWQWHQRWTAARQSSPSAQTSTFSNGNWPSPFPEVKLGSSTTAPDNRCDPLVDRWHGAGPARCRRRSRRPAHRSGSCASVDGEAVASTDGLERLREGLA